MVTLKRAAEKYGMACLLHEKPFAGHQRLGQARQLLDGQCDPGQSARPGRHAARQCAVPGLLRGGHPYGPSMERAAARRRRDRLQRPSPRRQRSPAGDHLGLPRRSAHRHLRSDRERRRQELQGQGNPDGRRRHACRRSRKTPAIATAPAPSPLPAIVSSSAPSARRSRSPAR